MADFAPGDKAIWKNRSGEPIREVLIESARLSYSVLRGEKPEDGTVVYDINDPVIGGTVFGIRPESLDPITTDCPEPHPLDHRCFDCATDDELAAAIPPYPAPGAMTARRQHDE